MKPTGHAAGTASKRPRRKLLNDASTSGDDGNDAPLRWWLIPPRDNFQLCISLSPVNPLGCCCLLANPIKQKDVGMQIQEKTVVSFEYTLKNAEGQVLGTSEGNEPLKYLHGVGQIVPGLEQAMVGKAQGDEMNVIVEPENGYGQRDENLVQPVPRERFEGIEKIEPGMQFTAQTEQGPRQVTVADVAEDSVTIDANHPLAGQTLHFDVKVLEVREATAEEVDHGHVH